MGGWVLSYNRRVNRFSPEVSLYRGVPAERISAYIAAFAHKGSHEKTLVFSVWLWKYG